MVQEMEQRLQETIDQNSHWTNERTQLDQQLRDTKEQ
jgi:hypothetical protein